MSILGIGVDLVGIPDFRTRIKNNPAFIKNVFTNAEIEWCDAYKDPIERYAARFAVKEAFYKALPQWVQDKVNWLDVETLPGANGRPDIYPSSECRVLLEKIGVSEIFLSISHETEYAIANVIIVGHQ